MQDAGLDTHRGEDGDAELGGARALVQGVRVWGTVVYGLWCMVHGLRFMVHGLGFRGGEGFGYRTLWFMVYGLWFMIYGLRFMVYVLWFKVYG